MPLNVRNVCQMCPGVAVAVGKDVELVVVVLDDGELDAVACQMPKLTALMAIMNKMSQSQRFLFFSGCIGVVGVRGGFC